MKSSVRQVVVVGMLGAITVVMGATSLGFIPIPPVRATIMHLPVILAGIFEGPLAGALTGAIFGAFSMYQAATIGTPIAKLLFLNPLIAFGPRILIGVVAYYSFRAAGNKFSRAAVGVLLSAIAVRIVMVSLAKPGATAYLVIAAVLAALGAVLYVLTKGDDAAPGLAALLGTLTNTAGVLGLGVAFKAIPAPLAWTVAITNSPAEVFVAVVVTTLIYKGVRRALPGMTSRSRNGSPLHQNR